jgi:hypothetical protein
VPLYKDVIAMLEFGVSVIGNEGTSPAVRLATALRRVFSPKSDITYLFSIKRLISPQETT